MLHESHGASARSADAGNSNLAAGLTIGLFFLSLSAVAAATDIATEIPNAKVVWEHGNELYYSTIGNWNPQKIKPGYRPKWSPDGTEILYSVNDRLFIMKSDFTGDQQIMSSINAGWWATGYSWTRDGKFVTVIMSDKRTVRKYDRSTGTSTVIYTDPSQDLAESAELDPTGRFLLIFRLAPNHLRVWDLSTQSFVSNSNVEFYCTPAWAPDGSHFLTTTPSTIMKVAFDASAPSMANVEPLLHVYGPPNLNKHHFMRMSNDGNWLVFSGAPSTSDYDVYIWKIGDPDSNAVKLTTGGGQSPSIFIPTAGAANVTIDSLSANTSTITQGDSATISWQTSNASSTSINQGIGAVSADGSTVVTPSATTTYTLTAQGQNGPVTDQVTITVNTAPDPTVITNPATGGQQFEENSIVLFDGTGANLVWSYDISGDGSNAAQFGTGGTVALAMPTGLSLPATLTITLVGDGGTATQTHTIVAEVKPTITVTSPNGGETLLAGQDWPIQWNTQGIDDVRLNYSLDGGQTWLNISQTVDYTNPGWGDYTWTVPDVDSAQVLIQVVSYFGEASDRVRTRSRYPR